MVAHHIGLCGKLIATGARACPAAGGKTFGSVATPAQPTFIRATFHRYATLEHACHPGELYGGRLSGQKFFRLPSSVPFLVMHEKQREALLNDVCPG